MNEKILALPKNNNIKFSLLKAFVFHERVKLEIIMDMKTF